MVEGPIPLPESLDRDSAVALHEEVVRRLRGGPGEIVLDASRVRRADAFGAAAILESRLAAGAKGSRVRIEGVTAALREHLAFLRVDQVAFEREPPVRREGFLARLGGRALDARDRTVELLALNMDGLYYTFLAPLRGRGARGSHLVHQVNAIGTGSVGIVVLISFLIGLIMALQSAYQLRQFGANIFVANLVGIVMTRELGPLLTAVILAARSGSSIAAELGTMVVTEEVDALRVLAVDPKRFLFAPRYVALAVALPCLAILADIAGIAGGFTVGVFGLDIGFSHYWRQTVEAILLKDLLTGLVKSFVFANVIAVVCCQMGLSLRGGPEEVGRATTRAVVLSIVLVIVTDFVFTALFYLMD